MITSLTSINTHTYKFFLLVMRTFKISPSNFRICNTVLLAIVTALYIIAL